MVMKMAKVVSMLSPQKLAYPATLTMVRVTVKRTMAEVTKRAIRTRVQMKTTANAIRVFLVSSEVMMSVE